MALLWVHLFKQDGACESDPHWPHYITTRVTPKYIWTSFVVNTATRVQQQRNTTFDQPDWCRKQWRPRLWTSSSDIRSHDRMKQSEKQRSQLETLNQLLTLLILKLVYIRGKIMIILGSSTMEWTRETVARRWRVVTNENASRRAPHFEDYSHLVNNLSLQVQMSVSPYQQPSSSKFRTTEKPSYTNMIKTIRKCPTLQRIKQRGWSNWEKTDLRSSQWRIFSCTAKCYKSNSIV